MTCWFSVIIHGFLLLLEVGRGAGEVLQLDPLDPYAAGFERGTHHAKGGSKDFQLGYLYLQQRSLSLNYMFTILPTFCTGLTTVQINQAMRHLLASWGMSLNELSVLAIRNPTLERLSHDINSCTVAEGMTEMDKEFVLNVALSVWPWNAFAAKNLAWSLEWAGNPHIARSLYRQASQILGDLGSLLHRAFVSPPLLWTKEEALVSHLKILAEANDLLTNTPKPANHGTDPGLVIREYQLCWQYTGISPGVVSNVYSRVLRHLFPYIGVEDPYVLAKVGSNSSNMIVDSGKNRPPIRLGIFSEHQANSSPGLCLMSILPRLSQLTHRDEHGVEVRDFHIVYFRRLNSKTVFNDRMEEIAMETVTLDHNPGHHELCRQKIVSTRLDILMFIALPTEKFTVFLSHARLAPIQIQFGIGHPITSGSPAIDYSVVSHAMFLSEKSITHSPPTNVVLCLEWASGCLDEVKRYNAFTLEMCSRMRRLGCITDGDSKDISASTFYTEQVVIFESLGYFIDDPTTYYEDTKNFNPLTFSFDTPCAELDRKLQGWGLYPNLTASMVGCRTMRDHPRSVRTSHIYIGIQNPKKMHPSFDDVLAGIVARDPHAKILVDYRMPCLIPRWKITLNLTETQIYERFIFVPRLEHRQYLQLVSLASVFLNTFPFGAGVTSSEAIALCVPVLVYAETSSVLHIALAQVRSLGDRWTNDFVVKSLDDYIEKALKIINLETPNDPNGLRRYRQELCDSRDNLVGEKPLAAATKEWELFLKRLM